MKNKKEDKLCMVCGDLATGYHFHAITCEACKLFFKRNAMKNEELYHCFLGNKCNINVNTRNSCKPCRLAKCFAVGMKSNAFQTEEQKQMRKTIRKRDINYRSETSDENSTSNKYPSHQTSDDVIYDNFPNVLADSELSLKTTNAYDLNLSVIPVMKPITDYNNQFNELEGNRLSELLDALKVMMNPMVNVNDNEINAYSVDAFNLILRCQENGLQNNVQMAKRLNGFKSLCEHDQLTLIKYASIEIVVLRMILTFDFNKLCWSFNINNHNHIVKLHLTAIILFNPNRPSLINKTAIKLQYYIYVHLLQRYLQLRYRSDELSVKGYHFRAITCEACKLFFRRNAPKHGNSFNTDDQEQLKNLTVNDSTKLK
ncbi:unnamed protein product, partial [Oppiella nova]